MEKIQDEKYDPINYMAIDVLEKLGFDCPSQKMIDKVEAMLKMLKQQHINAALREQVIETIH